MAIQDDVYIPQLAKLDLQTVNEAFRQAFTRLAYLEGRTGPTQVRDDLTVLGTLGTTEAVGAGTESPSEVLDIAGKVTADANGRILANITPDYDLASNAFSPSISVDPNGRAGDNSYGGTVTIPDGKVLSLINMTGTMTSAAPLVGESHLEGLRFNMKNIAAGTIDSSRLRPIIGTATLGGTSGGSVRSAHLRADAENGATGMINALALGVGPSPTSTVNRGLQITADSTADKVSGIFFEATSRFNTGIEFPSTFTASNAAIQLKTGGTNGLVRWDDLTINNNVSNILEVGSLSSTPYTIRQNGNNGAYIEYGWATELLTLSTAGTTTDTSVNILPARAVIHAVCTYVTQDITGAGITSYSVGNPTTATLFVTTESGLTTGSSRVGHGQWNTSANAATTGPFTPVTTAPVRITANGGTPTGGQIRIVVFYEKASAPTS